jgi:hypothetical protein
VHEEPPVSASTQISKGGEILPPETQEDRKPAAKERVKLAVEPSAPSRPLASPAGKMSLGRSNSSDNAEVPAPDNGEAWNTYMQNRFSGGMNYEGLGARFSKGP